MEIICPSCSYRNAATHHFCGNCGCPLIGLTPQESPVYRSSVISYPGVTRDFNEVTPAEPVPPKDAEPQDTAPEEDSRSDSIASDDIVSGGQPLEKPFPEAGDAIKREESEPDFAQERTDSVMQPEPTMEAEEESLQSSSSNESGAGGEIPPVSEEAGGQPQKDDGDYTDSSAQTDFWAEETGAPPQDSPYAQPSGYPYPPVQEQYYAPNDGPPPFNSGYQYGQFPPFGGDQQPYGPANGGSPPQGGWPGTPFVPGGYPPVPPRRGKSLTLVIVLILVLSVVILSVVGILLYKNYNNPMARLERSFVKLKSAEHVDLSSTARFSADVGGFNVGFKFNSDISYAYDPREENLDLIANFRVDLLDMNGFVYVRDNALYVGTKEGSSRRGDSYFLEEKLTGDIFHFADINNMDMLQEIYDVYDDLGIMLVDYDEFVRLAENYQDPRLLDYIDFAGTRSQRGTDYYDYIFRMIDYTDASLSAIGMRDFESCLIAIAKEESYYTSNDEIRMIEQLVDGMQEIPIGIVYDKSGAISTLDITFETELTYSDYWSSIETIYLSFNFNMDFLSFDADPDNIPDLDTSEFDHKPGILDEWADSGNSDDLSQFFGISAITGSFSDRRNLFGHPVIRY